MSDITISGQRWSLGEAWPLYWGVFSLMNTNNTPHESDGGHVYVNNGQPRSHAVLSVFGLGVPKTHVAHHRNEFAADDRPENLQVVERGQHASHHRKGVSIKMPESMKERLRQTMIAKAQTPEWRVHLKTIAALRGNCTLEAIKKSADHRRGQKRTDESRQRMREAALRRWRKKDD